MFAVDLRGQGRSTRTPGRHTRDNMGNDLVRFISGRIRRPVVVAGLSSGGVIAAWLSAYAPSGRLRRAYYENAPLFSSEIQPAYGHGMHQVIGPWFTLINKYLGDQWSVGDRRGPKEATARELPPVLAQGLAQMADFMGGEEPPQTWKECDPEWARAFAGGSAGASCDHARMLASVKVPVLFSHHFRKIDEESGRLQGAISDLQVRHARELITRAGQRFDCKSFPTAGHVMHQSDLQTYVTVLREWISTLDA
ncbi:alpha/beta hydrolase [Kitasatospora sp. NPDC004669]|uniref:alpha/beta fold hydrolase n=1 Tax=Kitasatospora sp. NPDC004669 TaxID=3154555 RepID=UPI0033B733F7